MSQDRWIRLGENYSNTSLLLVNAAVLLAQHVFLVHSGLSSLHAVASNVGSSRLIELDHLS